MMPRYAEPQNMTGIMDIFEYANSVSDNIFGVGIVITLYAVVFGWLILRGEEAPDCAIVAGFITSIASVFIYIGGLISGWHLFMVFMLTILPALWAYYRKSG
jgi:hypothetical protein